MNFQETVKGFFTGLLAGCGKSFLKRNLAKIPPTRTETKNAPKQPGWPMSPFLCREHRWRTLQQIAAKQYFFCSLLVLAFHSQPLFSSPSQGHSLFKSIWSPYCKGVSLLECPSSQAEDLRQQIRVRLEAGESEEAILKDLKSTYGDQLRMSPELEGRESLAYWLPWLFFALVVAVVILFLVRRYGGKSRTLAAENEIKEGPVKVASKFESQILEDVNNR